MSSANRFRRIFINSITLQHFESLELSGKAVLTVSKEPEVPATHVELRVWFHFNKQYS